MAGTGKVRRANRRAKRKAVRKIRKSTMQQIKSVRSRTKTRTAPKRWTSSSPTNRKPMDRKRSRKITNYNLSYKIDFPVPVIHKCSFFLFGNFKFS